MSHDVVPPVEGTVHPTGDADGSVTERSGNPQARATGATGGAPDATADGGAVVVPFPTESFR